MKAKKIFKIIGGLLLVFFTTLYFAQAAGYIEAASRRKTILTEDAIRRFEDDVAAGIEIDFRNYLPAERDYHNRFTRVGRGASSIIENGFNTIMGHIFREINKAVNAD